MFALCVVMGKLISMNCAMTATWLQEMGVSNVWLNKAGNVEFFSHLNVLNCQLSFVGMAFGIRIMKNATMET